LLLTGHVKGASPPLRHKAELKRQANVSNYASRVLRMQLV